MGRRARLDHPLPRDRVARRGGRLSLGVYLEADAGVVPALPRVAAYYWHELRRLSRRRPGGRRARHRRDVYRSGGAEMLVVEGGPRGAFDLPVARPFVRILAPRRGEIVADPDALDLPTPDRIRRPPAPRPPRPRKGEPHASRPPSATEAPSLAAAEPGGSAGAGSRPGTRPS